MARQCALVTLALAAAALAGGCNKPAGNAGGAVSVDGSGGGSPPPGPATPPPQLHPPISDVPVPYGFGLDEDKSRNYAVAGVRFVDHVYKGKGDKFALKRFFERYMPMNRWVLSTFIFAQGQMVLDFDRPDERCRVTIRDNETWGTATVSVLVWPDKAREADAAEPPS